MRGDTGVVVDRCCDHVVIVSERVRAICALLIQVCADYCRERSSSYKHYATQYGRECWCQDESIHLRHGAGTCDYQCSGDESIVCGGFDSFSLYDLEERELPSPPKDDNYVGCFADDRNDRVLGAKSSSREMTSEVDRQAGLHRSWKSGNTPYLRT